MGIDISWESIARARRVFEADYGSYHTRLAHYCAWMRDHWGIDHGAEHVAVIDEKKYAVFLLRFA